MEVNIGQTLSNIVNGDPVKANTVTGRFFPRKKGIRKDNDNVTLHSNCPLSRPDAESLIGQRISKISALVDDVHICFENGQILTIGRGGASLLMKVITPAKT